MVGKARSSNFTLSEKLDLLKLVKPYVKILEEHTNKHSVIVEKNKCWDIIADNYNAIGVDRPPRTAQGLRTLYKRLKEYAKQELLQQKETPSDCKSSISEPTKKVVEMIPQISNVCLRDRSGVQSASIDKETIAGTSSPQAMLDHHPATVMMELQSEEDVKPPPSLIIDSQQSENLEHEEEHQLVHIMERSPSTSVSSVDMRVMMSPSPVPRRDEFFRLEVGERFRPMCGSDPQMLQMLKEEHQIILENQRKIGLYVQEKRDGLKRKQQLEEELLRTKIKVEKLKAIRLRRDLPEYSNAACLPASGTAKEEAAQEEPDCLTKYFSVVWCKASKKKHKKWEGDAVLVTKGKSVILKDMEGKDIGRGTGYKPKELDSLDEGQTLMIGGKEIEVMGVISADDFSSGRCFQTGIATHDTVPTALPQATMKRFCKPFKNVCQPNTKENILNNSQSCKPRHDPNASNSLVMPRPNASHQWMFNKAGLPVVDVVVDPYIANNLRPHQKEGIVFLYECVMGMRVCGRFGAILADEMGLGKTLQCISLVWTLLRQGVYGCKPVLKRALIVTPGSLVKNWKKEFQKWLGSERIKVFTVDQDHKVEEFISSPLYSVMIISYEMLLRSLEQIQAIEFNLLICDEGHRLKNSSIKTTTALTSLPCERRIILTGTPIQNDLQEFYALIEFVNPGVLGSLSTYRKIYEEPIVRSREPSATKEEKELGEKRAAELTRLTGLFILRRTQEVINKFLPPKKESIIFCRPTALQLELYRKLLSSQVIRSCLQGRLENSPHLICIGALKKLCNHPCLLFKAVKEKSCDPMNDEHDESSLYEGLTDVFPQDYTSDTFSETDSGKLQVLVKLLAAIHELNSSERVVLVSNYTQTLNILQEICKSYGYSYTRLDGHTPVSQRQHIVDSFNSKFSPAFIFLLSSKAGGVGLNLVGASHLILYDIDWNPATDIQAMARVWRDGQKHTVHIYRLLTTGSIEEKIYQRQISKQDLSGAVVDLSKTSEHIHFSVEELKNLFTLHEDSSCVTHDLLECDCMGNRDHQNPSSEKPSASRSCQLGQDQGKPNSKKPLSMSQLMQWKHFSGQHQALADPFLERIKENVSFIFQNVTSPTSPAQ